MLAIAPSPTFDNIRHRRNRNAETFGYFPTAKGVGKGSDFGSLSVRQLGDTATLRVAHVRNWLDMVGVAARAIAASNVVKFRPCGDRSVPLFIEKPMSSLGATVSHHPSISVRVFGALPNPTAGRGIHDVRQSGLDSLMTRDEAAGLPFDATFVPVRGLCQWRGMTTAARAKHNGWIDSGIVKTHSADLLHRSVGCRAGDVSALPGFSLPKLYQTMLPCLGRADRHQAKGLNQWT